MRAFLQYVLPLLGLAICVTGFLGLITVEVLYILPTAVALPASEGMPEWLEGYRITQQEWVLIPTIALAVVWLVVCLTKPSYEGDNRTLWWVLWVLDAVAALICIILGKLEADTGLVPEVLTLLNAIILFWLATAPFSPVTHKFAPLGSALARKLW
jgi:hypothetical protein